jgi:hypothetical protein
MKATTQPQKQKPQQDPKKNRLKEINRLIWFACLARALPVVKHFSLPYTAACRAKHGDARNTPEI